MSPSSLPSSAFSPQREFVLRSLPRNSFNFSLPRQTVTGKRQTVNASPTTAPLPRLFRISFFEFRFSSFDFQLSALPRRQRPFPRLRVLVPRPRIEQHHGLMRLDPA